LDQIITERKTNAQQQFGKMAGSVLKSTAVLRLNFCAKLNICASISATSPSCKTLCATYFPNLRRKLFSYFSERNLLKLLPKNFAGKLKTEPNFVDKLCAENTFSGKSVVK